MKKTLTEELRLLYRAERDHKVPAAPVIRQLVAYESGVLPDRLPVPPEWVNFQWPESGDVDLAHYWRTYDRARHS